MSITAIVRDVGLGRSTSSVRKGLRGPRVITAPGANQALLRLIPPEIEPNVSVKLSNLGFEV